jgi:hypothetical protein
MTTTFALSDNLKNRIAKNLRRAEIRKLSPIARAAQRRANETGKPVGYAGGSNKVGVSSGIAQPMAPLPTFKSSDSTGTGAATSTANADSNAGYNPGALSIGGSSFGSNLPTNDSPAMKFLPGGASADIDTNASGFRRKKSSTRLAGLTTKGTSRFKIPTQVAQSSGLNIGV